jgi:predicted nucleotidyltransferase
MQLDLVPLDEKVLGFANRWYRPGFESAVTAILPSGLQLRHLSAPYFMATKLEAFKDRGNNDVYLSHDLEDVIAVVDGREELIHELTAARPDVRDFVAQTLLGILRQPDFTNVLPGIVSQSTRTGLVLQRFTQMSEL